jgi:hypothetical protein
MIDENSKRRVAEGFARVPVRLAAFYSMKYCMILGTDGQQQCQYT